MMNLTEKLLLIPAVPGVYLFKSKEKRILYIGKALQLKKRVASYFQKNSTPNPRHQSLLQQTDDLDWIVTLNETEALLLEERLIKQHQPKYNIRLKGQQQSYPYLQLSIHEPFPRLFLTRKVINNGSLYFGPYVNVQQAKLALKTVLRFFPLRQRKCQLDGQKRGRPCLNYQIKRCAGPCTNKISPVDYMALAIQVQHFLQGHQQQLISLLKNSMQKKSAALLFEEAAGIRNKITAIQKTFAQQQIINQKHLDQDIFSLIRQDQAAGVQVLFIRKGVLLSKDFFYFHQAEQCDDHELFRATFYQLYLQMQNLIPDEIVLPIKYNATSILQNYFAKQKHKKVTFRSGTKKDYQALLSIAYQNAEQSLQIKIHQNTQQEALSLQIKQDLKLHNLPLKVECFDISNFAGSNNVASMVVWENHQPAKTKYRKYKIQTVDGANDVACMQEVLTRHYQKILQQPDQWPHLIIVDGGKGQLNAAVFVLTQLGYPLNKIDLIGLAKGRSYAKNNSHLNSKYDHEYIIKPQRKNPILLKKHSPTLHFLQRIRDEAHRFAITFQQTTQHKQSLTSILSSIPGIGPKKQQQLLLNLKSIENIQKANIETLSSITGISVKNAQNIYDYFHQFRELES